MKPVVVRLSIAAKGWSASTVSMISDGLQGRVNSGFRLICFSMNPVGAALCGLTREWCGTNATVALFSAFYLAFRKALTSVPKPGVALRSRNPLANRMASNRRPGNA